MGTINCMQCRAFSSVKTQTVQSPLYFLVFFIPSLNAQVESRELDSSAKRET